MIRAAILAFALVATPAFAAPAFQAQAEVAPAAAKFVLRDTLWNCDGATCAAPAGNTRPAVVCAVLAKDVGTLRSFSFRGAPLPADDLAKCNARAKKISPNEVRTAARP